MAPIFPRTETFATTSGSDWTSVVEWHMLALVETPTQSARVFNSKINRRLVF
jgi:hypothetical protein